MKQNNWLMMEYTINEYVQLKFSNPVATRVEVYKFIGYVEMKEMFGLPMAIPVAKEVEINEGLIAEVREQVG